MSTNPNVREIGHFEDLDGRKVTVGVDYTAITVSAPFRVDAAGFEEFSQLAIAARHQADRCEAESDNDDGPRPARRPVLTSKHVFDVLYSAGFTPWGNGEPGFTTGWYMDAITVDHVGADLPVHGPLEGPRAIVADYSRTLFAAGFNTHVTVNTVLVRKRAATETATAGKE